LCFPAVPSPFHAQAGHPLSGYLKYPIFAFGSKMKAKFNQPKDCEIFLAPDLIQLEISMKDTCRAMIE